MRRVVLLLLVGCGGPEPERQVPTDRLEIDVIFEAVGDGGSTLYAELSTADGAAYQLEGEDELVGILAGSQFTLVYDRYDETPVYSADFFEAPVDVEATLAFSRKTEESAPHSRVTLPPELEVSGPSALSRSAEDLVVTWSPSGLADPIAVTILGACVETYEAELDDVGSWTLPAGSLVSRTDEACDAELRLYRYRDGAVDDSYAGGAAVGRQRRDLAITIAP